MHHASTANSGESAEPAPAHEPGTMPGTRRRSWLPNYGLRFALPISA